MAGKWEENRVGGTVKRVLSKKKWAVVSHTLERPEKCRKGGEECGEG